MVDDIIVWWLSDEVFDVMPNASNTDRVVEAIGGEDTTAARCIIAVQGPHARTRLATVAPEAAAVPRFGVAPFVWEGVRLRGCRHRLHRRGRRRVRRAGGRRRRPVDGPAGHRRPARRPRCPGHAPPGGRPCPCTATSSARASPRCRPGWAGWSAGTRTTFRGRAALLAERERGVGRRLVGLATDGSPAAPRGIGA